MAAVKVNSGPIMAAPNEIIETCNCDNCDNYRICPYTKELEEQNEQFIEEIRKLKAKIESQEKKADTDMTVTKNLENKAGVLDVWRGSRRNLGTIPGPFALEEEGGNARFELIP